MFCWPANSIACLNAKYICLPSNRTGKSCPKTLTFPWISTSNDVELEWSGVLVQSRVCELFEFEVVCGVLVHCGANGVLQSESCSACVIVRVFLFGGVCGESDSVAGVGELTDGETTWHGNEDATLVLVGGRGGVIGTVMLLGEGGGVNDILSTFREYISIWMPPCSLVSGQHNCDKLLSRYAAPANVSYVPTSACISSRTTYLPWW